MDIADGPGVRVSLFVSGCRNHCPGCFQPETWAFDYGDPYTDVTQKLLLSLLNHSWIQGLTLLGGDPMEPENQQALLSLAQEVKRQCPTKDIWLYTGYTWDEVRGSLLLPYIDVLVDGKFIESQKDLTLLFRGSSNQRLIDVQKSLQRNEVVLWDENAC